MAHPVGGQLLAEPAGTGHEIRAAGQDRLDHSPDLARLVLAVGVDRRDHVGPAGPRQPVAEAQRGALATVDGHVAHERARAARLGGGAVLGAVDDDDHLDLQPGGLGRDLRDHAGDGRLLVVRRDHHRQRRAGARRMGGEERRGAALRAHRARRPARAPASARERLLAGASVTGRPPPSPGSGRAGGDRVDVGP